MVKRPRFLTLLGVLLLACVGGHIPPSTFQFTNTVLPERSGRSGWKVAQVVVLLSRISSIFPGTATCEIEVGVPEINRNGPVSDEFAQVMAARAADEAARLVLKEKQPTALVCIQFREHMRFILGDSNTGLIPGARVSGFITTGVPKKNFP